MPPESQTKVVWSQRIGTEEVTFEFDLKEWMHFIQVGGAMQERERCEQRAEA